MRGVEVETGQFPFAYCYLVRCGDDDRSRFGKRLDDGQVGLERERVHPFGRDFACYRPRYEHEGSAAPVAFDVEFCRVVMLASGNEELPEAVVFHPYPEFRGEVYGDGKVGQAVGLFHMEDGIALRKGQRHEQPGEELRTDVGLDIGFTAPERSLHRNGKVTVGPDLYAEVP